MNACKLCKLEYEKFPNSHIIPAFMYKSLKNEKSQLLRMSMPMGKPLKPIFTGYYEKPLLCYDCEAKLNKWENYAEKILYGSPHVKMPVAKTAHNGITQDVTDIDYHLFKLFLLSILWRASKTSNDFFKGVSLGREHEDKIAEMLLNEAPGDEYDYPVMLIIPNGKIGSDVSIMPPYKNKNSSNAVRYIFPISEVIYVYHVSKHGLEEIEKIATIKKDNTIKLILWPVSRLNAFLELYQVEKAIKNRLNDKFFNRPKTKWDK